MNTTTHISTAERLGRWLGSWVAGLRAPRAAGGRRVAGFGWHAGRCRDRAGGLLYSAFWLALLLVCLLLDATGDKLVLKKYCHIAFAAETPIGLLTPMVRNVDQKDIFETANAIHALAQKAKAGRLALSDAEGA